MLPKIAIFPIVMLMFADPFGEGPKIAVVALSVFFLMAINTMAGVRDIDPVYLMAGRNYGARGLSSCSGTSSCRRRCRSSLPACGWRSAPR